MEQEKERIRQLITVYYSHNIFMQYCGIKIEHLDCGLAKVGVTIDPVRHGNLNGAAHGGLLATLADNSTGIAAATVGKRVVTVSMDLSFISSLPVGNYAVACGRIAGRSGRQMFIDVDLTCDSRLILKAHASMLEFGVFEGVPEVW